MRPLLLLALAAVFPVLAADTAFERASKKLDRIESGRALPGSVIVFTPDEMNAWARGRVPEMYQGIRDPSVQLGAGTASGFAFVDFQMVGKWLEMLKEAAPGVSRALVMFNPDTSPHFYIYLHSFEAVPRSIAVEITAAPVRDTAEIEEALAKLGRNPGGGVIVPPDAFSIVHHPLFIRLMQQHRLPAIYAVRTYVAEGALMSYGPDPLDNFRRSASYVDRILRGAKPADLPVQTPVKYELAINLKTARVLGLTVPDTLLARADEVIE
jgi:putative ABC transport system substrate-binding protein